MTGPDIAGYRWPTDRHAYGYGAVPREEVVAMSARQVRRFELEREVDVSGVSGTGLVAFGAQAPDGTCVLWWHSEHDSIAIYPTMETLLAIHGHGGTTRVVYIDAQAGPAQVSGRKQAVARSAGSTV
ncbi:conserved hypothetical protein [Frankia canadensis]|uniref:Uncharacterized protein n=1 Tax=Frankia canadensis TaxID=1836972 RepID=A0A2I2KWA4_9ACTN|nr:hypothetical protein [Frankia canadensis]SNQ49935.1 conserved hypothetical protein [Frankia canadensis]SOU57225.1 conserved hypothetical protein [Frankia canadensis]